MVPSDEVKKPMSKANQAIAKVRLISPSSLPKRKLMKFFLPIDPQRWPCVKTFPETVLPFIRTAIDVPALGLCAFASVAVSLGRSVTEAPAVRAEMLAEVKGRLAWYTEHLPSIATSKFDIKKILSILENTALMVEHKYYYPIPGGCCIIANTYNRPVISFSDVAQYSATVFPFFSPPQDVQPIILGLINECHCISLSLYDRPELPIPFTRPEWFDLRDPIAVGWDERFLPHMEVYRQWRRRENKKDKSMKGVTVEVEPESSDLSEYE
jgi:hypothetical protein